MIRSTKEKVLQGNNECAIFGSVVKEESQKKTFVEILRIQDKPSGIFRRIGLQIEQKYKGPYDRSSRSIGLE